MTIVSSSILSLYQEKGVVMLYQIINSGKFRFRKAFIIYIIIISYAVTLKGCMTTDISYVTPEVIQPSTFENVSMIILKNRITIDCKNKKVNLEKENDSTFYFSLTNLASGEVYKATGEKQLIPVNDVLRIQLSDDRLSDGGVALIITGVLAIGILIAAAITFSNMNYGF